MVEPVFDITHWKLGIMLSVMVGATKKDVKQFVRGLVDDLECEDDEIFQLKCQGKTDAQCRAMGFELQGIGMVHPDAYQELTREQYNELVKRLLKLLGNL